MLAKKIVLSIVLANTFLFCAPTHAAPAYIPIWLGGLLVSEACSFGSSANVFASNDGIDKGDSYYAILPGIAWGTEFVAALLVAAFWAGFSHFPNTLQLILPFAVSTLLFDVVSAMLNWGSLHRLYNPQMDRTTRTSEKSIAEMKKANIAAVVFNGAAIVINVLGIFFVLPSRYIGAAAQPENNPLYDNL